MRDSFCCALMNEGFHMYVIADDCVHEVKRADNHLSHAVAELFSNGSWDVARTEVGECFDIVESGHDGRFDFGRCHLSEVVCEPFGEHELRHGHDVFLQQRP